MALQKRMTICAIKMEIKVECDANEILKLQQSYCGSICTKQRPVFWLRYEWDFVPSSAQPPCLSSS